jgi:hypothetical protein
MAPAYQAERWPQGCIGIHAEQTGNVAAAQLLPYSVVREKASRAKLLRGTFQDKG